MTKRYYKQIAFASEMRDLQNAADADGLVAIGVSKSGGLYKFDKLTGKVAVVSVEDAAEVLNCSVADVKAISESRGAYVVQDEVKPEVTAEEFQAVKNEIERVKELATAAQESVATAVGTIGAQVEEELAKSKETNAALVFEAVKGIEEKIDKLTESVKDLTDKLTTAIVD